MGEGLEMQQLVTDTEFEEERSSSTKSETLPRKWSYLGILLATISSIFFSLCSVIVKWMENVDPTQLAVCRFVGVLMPSIPIVIWKNQEIFPKGKRLILVLRSFVGATGLMLSFYAFRHMPLADASVIVFSVPVFVCIFAYIFLKEPCGVFNIITIVLSLIGVILIKRPTFIFGKDYSELSLQQAKRYGSWGAVAAFGATLFGANAIVLIRTLRSLHFSVLMANFGGFALLQTFAICWYLGVLCWPKCGLERLLVIAIALFSFAGQVLLTMALQVENAGPVAIARTSDIVFAFIWQILFFKEVPNVYSLLGAFLVTSSVVVTGLRKWVVSLPDNSPLKIKFNILAK